MEEYTGLIGLPVTGQSPINLDDRLVRERKYPPLVLNGHWLNEGEAKMINNGQTAKITLSGNRIPSTICGGPLVDDVYEFESAHFHWGEDNCNGAEHTINNTWYSMEGHVIHWNRKYHTMEECFRHKDGFCILAYLFLVQPGCCNCINPQLERITENLKDIVDTEMETKIPPNSLAWMRWATYCSRYYTYSGSFNVADYPECATWIVFPVVIPVRASELQNEPNEFMEGIVKNLTVIRTAHSSVRIIPANLTGILKPFSTDYFLYWGSITTPINIHNILWIICREPIGLTTKQIAEFRTLHDEKGVPILSNIRPVKPRQEKSVFHVSPSGSLYASLLPLPRVVPLTFATLDTKVSETPVSETVTETSVVSIENIDENNIL